MCGGLSWEWCEKVLSEGSNRGSGGVRGVVRWSGEEGRGG